MSEQLLRILESKRAFRSKLAALPFAEKIVLLEKLRQRSIAIGASRPNALESPIPHVAMDR